MKTDALFYELFKFDPQSLFDLIRVDAEGAYVFESITAKTTEKRMDGLFRSTDGAGPNLFAEVQGYPDKKIYWRFFREISTWYEQNDDDHPFLAVVLFTDKAFDPGNPGLFFAKPNRLIRCYLPNLLKKIGKSISPDCAEAAGAEGQKKTARIRVSVGCGNQGNGTAEGKNKNPE